ncbi:MAG: DUF4352 domain-containing protein [Candidatus Riflebacteria bacterium]|nr:DUF4352 domain-containing protein [Candidatus Riflebacteria bacterium]
MALIQCSECKKEISSLAEKCPSCGAPVPRAFGRQNVGWLIIGIALIVIPNLFMRIKNPPEEIRPISVSSESQITPEIKVVNPNVVTQIKSPPEEIRPISVSFDSQITAEKKVVILGKVGETVTIGYFSYCVWRSWWDNKTSNNQFINQKPNASFLFIELTVRNNDKKARTIPPFKLIDENNNEYDYSSKSFGVKNAFRSLEDLNPSVHKQGVILFDVPKGRNYKLKVSGGFWSKEDAIIEIR